MSLARWKFRHIFWSIAATIFLSLLGLAFWPRSVPVDFAFASDGLMSVTLRDQGYTRIRDVYSVTAPLVGRLLRVQKKAGDTVAADEIVARILPVDPSLLDLRSEATAQAMIRSAQAALSFAQAETQRAQSQVDYARGEQRRNEALLAIHGVAESTVARARLDLRTAEAALATAQASIRMREAELEAAQSQLLPSAAGAIEAGEIIEVRSPAAGRVLRVLQQSENIVGPGTSLLEVGDPAQLEVVLEMLSSDAVQIREGAPVTIDHWGANAQLGGIVRHVEPFGTTKISALGVEEQRVNVLVDLTDPPEVWAALAHGYRVEGAVEIWRRDSVIQVPVACLFRSGDSWALFRAEEGRARLTRVEVGQTNGETAEILSGVEPGETIVLYPGQDVADGARITQR
jgi:HlyD family secretion protein